MIMSSFYISATWFLRHQDSFFRLHLLQKFIVSITIVVAFLMTGTNSQPTLVLLGGNLASDNTQVWNQIVQGAGGVGVAQIGVIVTASGYAAEGETIVNNLVQTHGAKSATRITVTTPFQAFSPLVAQQVRQLNGVFIMGGGDSDRLRILRLLRPFGIDSFVLSAVKGVLTSGGMVAGNSGIMGKSVVITGGDPIGALTFGTRFTTTVSSNVAPTYHLSGGLGLLRNGWILDANLSDRGREVRLIRALLDTRHLPFIGTPKGLGVDANTALVVTNPLTSPVGQVVAATGAIDGVFFVNVTDVTTGSIWTGSYSNVPFSFLTVNDTIDLISGHVTFASFKSSLTGAEYFPKAVPSDDILSLNQPFQWRLAARSLIDSQETSVTNSEKNIAPFVQIVFDRSQALGYGSDLPSNQVYAASHINMLATISIKQLL